MQSFMQNSEKGKIVGIVGLVALIASWAAFLFAPHDMPAEWVPRLWMVALIVLTCSIVLAVVAGRMSSRWWYFLAAASFLSAAFLLAAVAD